MEGDDHPPHRVLGGGGGLVYSKKYSYTKKIHLSEKQKLKFEILNLKKKAKHVYI